MVIRRKEIIDDDIDDMKDYEKSILFFIDEHPKPKKYQIAENFRNLIDYEDISDLLAGWNDEGIIYMNYGYYELTDYGVDLVKEIRKKLDDKGREMNDEEICAYDFFDSDLAFIEQKFMSYDEAVDYAVETKTLFQKNIAHEILKVK